MIGPRFDRDGFRVSCSALLVDFLGDKRLPLNLQQLKKRFITSVWLPFAVKTDS
jgi:hypothetical protein